MLNPFTELKWHPDLAERRRFAGSLLIGFPILGALFAFIRFWRGLPLSPAPVTFVAIGVGVGLFCLALPYYARPFYLVWYVAASGIGLIISNLLLALFFYLIISPLGLLMRLVGRDPLHRRKGGSASTYWQTLGPSPAPETYFRQF